MRWPRTNRMVVKITAVVLLASSIALSVLVAALVVFDWISARALLESRLETLADVVGQNSTAAIEFNDKSAAVEVLGALRHEPPVMSACLYDAEERLFAEYQRDRGTGHCPANPGQLPGSGHGYTSATRPVYRSDEAVGTLFLKSDLEDARRRGKRLLGVACGLALVALVVGGVSGSLMQRGISKPMFELVRVMKEVTAQNHFSSRVGIEGCEEIALLGQGFNTMLAELERREEEKQRAEAKLQEQARTDALTGLPNRRLFAEQLDQTLAQAKRESHMAGLLYIDLDGFKLVNDSLGHSIGDRLLHEVAERLHSRVRRSDMLARLGGDEFTVILTNLKRQDEAEVVAESLLTTLNKPFRVEEHEIRIGASIGISLFPTHASEPIDLMRQADSAMYAAKRNGKNQSMYFHPELGLLVRERHNLENELRGAIGRGEIELHYQPEFDVNSGRLVRFEALARWFHPSLGLISPAKFVPIAEESGQITALGAYVLERACREAALWQPMTPLPVQVAVNVSSIQFRRETFVEEITELLRRTGLNPSLLQLELTETVMVGPVEHSAQKLRRLREMGISLAIDDFGTGYSCLSYLPSLPFDALKIDRSFLKDLLVRQETLAMVRALVALAHNVGMKVIVEGIEEEAQLRLIRQLGANEVQGFLLGRPAADPMRKLLASVGKNTLVGVDA